MSRKVLRAIIDITVLSATFLATYYFTASVPSAIVAVALVVGYGAWCFIDGCLQ